MLADLPPEGIAWVIGGAEIYRQLLPRCTFLYLTRVKLVASGDVYLPAFEDDFLLDQVIHETPTYRIERWKNQRLKDEDLPPESWPFAEPVAPPAAT